MGVLFWKVTHQSGGPPDLRFFPKIFQKIFFAIHVLLWGYSCHSDRYMGGIRGEGPPYRGRGGYAKGGVVDNFSYPPFLWISLFVGVKGVPYLCEFAICVPHLRTSNGSISGYFS